MASTGYGQSQDQLRALVAEAKKLTVDKLKTVLRQEGLTVSGVKSELQIRIIAHIEQAHNVGDTVRIDRIRTAIKSALYFNGTAAYPSPYSNSTPTSSVSPQFSSPAPRISHSISNGYMMGSSHQYSSNRVAFKKSPFYTIIRSLSNVVECKERESTRDTIRITIDLTPDVAEKLQKDDNCRIMVFCAADSYPSLMRESDIAFPHQVELKCNSDELKANLRGLKGKAGSTRPADITKMIRKKANYPNLLEMVYALTNKKFYLVVNLVQRKPIDELVSELSRGNYLSKDRVILEMQTKASDTDIVATSSVLSLKCPLSYTRIATPCRSIACNHNQCFDAASYLQLQEQAPTWTCPICNRPATWDNLVIDQYVNDILNSTSNATEQVTIEPDGRWYMAAEVSGGTQNSDRSSTYEDEDDLIEIPDERVTSLKPQTPMSSGFRTPPVFSRDVSGAPSASKSQKRPRDVIDLTLSDEEEDADTQPAKVKRTSMYPSDPLRSRPPDRYHFQMPPPSTSDFDFTRFEPSF